MKKTNISWTDFSWNPWQGCAKVSEGCARCYMFRDKERWAQDPKKVVLSSHATFCKPLKIKKPCRIFTCSWSDFFIKDADDWREAAWDIIKKTPHIQYQILTKRPERILDCLPADWEQGYPNVWLGVSVENQARAAERIPFLLDIPCAVRFLSVEPLLDKVDLSPYLYSQTEHGGIKWVIIGGESGTLTGKFAARPCKLEWIAAVMEQCFRANVPFFLKQVGTVTAKDLKLKNRSGADVYEQTLLANLPFGLEPEQLQNFPNE